MRWKFWKEKTTLEKLIDIVETRMLESDVDSAEYVLDMEKLKQLYEIRGEQHRSPVSSDTILVCITNIAGILTIVIYENRHVITSKGFSQLMKPKLPHQQ